MNNLVQITVRTNYRRFSHPDKVMQREAVDAACKLLDERKKIDWSKMNTRFDI